MARLTLPELEALLDTHAPRWRIHARILTLGDDTITVAMQPEEGLVRAGGTLSGPPLMALADRAAYYLTLSHVPDPRSVTVNLAIHFLARPKPHDIRASAKLLKLGHQFATTTVELHAGEQLVAHATVTYALPV